MTLYDSEQIPVFLRSYEDLSDHLHSQLGPMTNVEKGDIFARFIGRIIPISKHGAGYGEIELQKKSHDGGVDLRTQSQDGVKVLLGQSKLTLRGVDDLDLIISKFKNAHDEFKPTAPAQQHMFDTQEETTVPEVSFLIASLSKIKTRILPEYEKSSRPSRTFYDLLKHEGRIIFLDGTDILPLLQSAYRKLHVLPSDVELTFETPIIHRDNVYISVLSAGELQSCYAKFGDSLFLDNIRTFLGYSDGTKKDRENVNDAIRETAEHRPEDMLSRNNGITFRAETVQKIGDQKLRLNKASIVNGCQTTMCIVESSRSDASVLVKIVEIAESWDIAKAANFQNQVEQVALDLARYVRPQVVRLAASRSGINVSTKHDSVFDVFSEIYQEEVRYDEIRFLFLGIFSRAPRNAISKNYTELRTDLLSDFKFKDPTGEATFDTLFKLCRVAREGQKSAESVYTDGAYKTIFQRFWRDNKPDYRSIITILAACGCVRVNIYQPSTNMQVIFDFLEELHRVIENDRAKLVRYYNYAFEAIANYLLVSNADKDETELLRTMYDSIRRANFETLYKQVCLAADGRETTVAGSN